MDPNQTLISPLDKLPATAAFDELSIDFKIFSKPSISKETALDNLRKMLTSRYEEPVACFSDLKCMHVKFNKLTSIESDVVVDALFDILQNEKELEIIERLDFINCDFQICCFRTLINRLNALPRITFLCFDRCNLNFIHSGLLFNAELPLRNYQKTIVITRQRIDVTFMEFLEKYLEGNPPLETLMLDECQLQDPEIQKLASCLKKNKTLKGLYLRDNGIRDAGAMDLAWMLRSQPTLEAMSLKGNRIGPAGAIAISQVLHDRVNPTFDLGLEGNPVQDEGACHLIEQADSMTRLGLSNAEGVHALTAIDAAVKRKGTFTLGLMETDVSDRAVKDYAANHAKRIRIDPNSKLKVHLSRTNLSSQSFESLKTLFAGTSVTVKCNPITADDKKYEELIAEINASTEPDQKILVKILAVKELIDREALFSLFLNMHFTIIQTPRNCSCLFTSVAEGLNHSNPYVAFRFIIRYLEKYSKDLPDLMADFQKITLDYALRSIAVHCIERRPDDFKPFMFLEDFTDTDNVVDDEEVDADKRFEDYCKTMKQLKTFGGEFEIQALSRIFEEFELAKTLVVFDASKKPQVVNGEFVMPELLSGNNNPAVEKIYLLYLQQERHYNLLIRKTKDELTL